MRNHSFRLTVRRIGILALVSFACCASLSAQEYIFNRLTTKDGLSSNRVYAVMRDQQGYLWMGTETGLQRYDGSTFIYPHYSGDNSLPQQAVYQILEDKKGNLWIKTGNTIGIFDTHTFRFRAAPMHFNKPPATSCEYNLSKDADGNVFVIVLGYNWLYFNEKTFAFEQSKAPFALPDSIQVRVICDDPVNKTMWICGRKGMMAYDKKAKELYTAAYNPKHLLLLEEKSIDHYLEAFFIDSRRRYWIANWDLPPGPINQTVRCWDEAQQKFTNDNAELNHLFYRYSEYNHITEFGDSNIIVYGDGCFVFNQRHKFESFYDSTSSAYNINYSMVYDVCQDKDNLLWVATDNGLYNTQAITSKNAHLILDPHKLRAEINSLLEYKDIHGDTGLWIGTYGARGVITTGKTVYDNSKVNPYKQPMANPDFGSVWDMMQHSRMHQVWMGCQHGNLQIYDPATDKSQYLTLPVFKGSTIRHIKEDAQGNVWFGCQNGTILKWNYGSDMTDSSFHYIMSTSFFISELYFDNKGMLWFGSASGNTGGGVFVLNPDNGKIIHHYLANNKPGSLSDNNIRQILQLNDSIYALAGDVLNLLNSNTGKVNLAYAANMKPLGKVLTLQVDNSNQIWVSTTTGIYKYNREHHTYKQYSQQDGLINVENEDYTLSNSLKLSNGDLVFGGSQNLVVFDPKQYSSTQSPPAVTITGVSVFTNNLSVDSLMKLREVELTHDKNSITIRFAALNFNETNKLTYYYRLKGADKDWIAADGFGASYNLLPPGSYTFQVRSQNDEGIYPKDITELNFYIRPSFWQSIWFYLLLAAATAGLLYYLHWSRIQRLLHVERVRIRLARDLHDDMGSTLSTINILSNMALQKVETDGKTTKEFISRIGNNSSRMMEAMDDIVWSINPVNDSMQKVTARMKEFAGNALEAKDIDYTFHIDENVKELHFDMDARRSIFLIFKEAVNNILKYAEASEVYISMQIKKKELLVSVEDNGKGFDPAKPTSTSRGNGVKNMQKRAEAMKGSMQLNTVLGKGTSLLLRIPVR